MPSLVFKNRNENTQRRALAGLIITKNITMSSSASSSNSAPGPVKDTPSNPLPLATKISLSTPKKPLNFSSPESQSFVTIHCKGAAQPFRIHKNVITHYSPFFSAAFNSDFKEGKTQSMSFEDVEAPIFGFFNNWLYTQKVVNEDGNRLQLIEYAKLWSLSQRFLMPELQAILLRETQDTLPSSDANSGSTLKDFQQYVYLVVDHQEDSDLKKVAIMKTLSSVNQNNIDAVMNSFPEGMLVDFTKALLEDCTQLRGWELGLGLGGVALSMKTENAVAVETPNIGMFGRHRRSR